MACAIRSAITFLSVSAVAGMMIVGCSSSDNGDDGSAAATGGVKASTGGTKSSGGSGTKAAGGAATGGAKATGGAATGGAKATGGANTGVGGTAATGGTKAGTTAAAGGTAATGGASAAVGGASAAVGGASAAVGGTQAAGGTAAAGGTTAGGGSSIPLPDCEQGDAGVAGVFCGVTSSEINLSGICATPCSAGGVKMTGSTNGLAITGKIYSADPVFDGNPVPNNIQGGQCAGFSATDPNNHKPYTSMTIGIKNNMASAQTINVTLADSPSGAEQVTYTLAASVNVPAGGTVEETLRWGTESSRCSQSDAGSCIDFAATCALGAGATFDPTHLLRLGLGVGNNATTYPITNVDIVITSITFE